MRNDRIIKNFKRKFPENVSIGDQQLFLKIQNFCIEAPELFHYKNVMITNNKFKGVVLEGFKLNIDSLPGDKNIEPEINLRFKLYSFFTTKKIYYDSKALIYNYWCSGYFHWLLDAIPRLYLLKGETSNYSLLFPEVWKDDNFHIKSLEPFNIEKFTFISNAVKCFKVKNLLMPSRVACSGIINPEIVQDMRNIYLNYFKEKLNLNFGPRIYITRKNASKRKIINENAVIEYLTKYGFKVVDFEEYDFVEKISIASKAKIIVSVHGAGLANILFMQNNGYVLELMHKEMKVLAYYFLADSLNLNYFYQKCEPVNNLKSFFTSDIIVDIKELEKHISLILKKVN